MAINGKFISISKAAKLLQVSPDTLRNWEKQGKIVAARTPGGARRYSRLELLALKKEIHPAFVQKGLLSVSRAAQALQVSVDTLRNWDKRQLVSSQRTKGGARRFTRAEVRRLQKELGIAEDKLDKQIEIPRLNLESARFSPPWFKIASTTGLMVLILMAGFMVKSYLDFQQGKTNENTRLIENLAKNIESLQRGVYGIQTQASPSPSPLPLISPIITTPDTSGLEIFGSAPITLDQSGEIGCASCLTVSSTYISSVTNSDGTIKISLQDKEATVSLDVGHANTWSNRQTFNQGLTLEDNSSLLILGKGTLAQTYLTSSSEAGNFVASQISATLSSVSTEGETSLYGLKVSANIPAVSAGGVTSAIGVYASAAGADNNFAAIFNQGNVGIGTTKPLTGKLVISQEAAGPEALYIDSAQSLLTEPVLSIESDAANGSGSGTVKFQVRADGSVYSDGIHYLSGGDLAEMYFVNDGVEEADVVELNYSETEGVGFVVDKATKDSANAILGVISTKPGSILAYDLTRLDLIHQQKPVALIGRASVKVSLENGPIEPGDYLTSSSTPGVAMKATHPGPTVGKALEAFNGEEIGKILAFINVSYTDPANFLASLSLDDQGNLIAPKLKVDQLLISSDPNNFHQPSTTNHQTYYDLSGKIASLEERLAVLEKQQSNEATSSSSIAYSLNSSTATPSTALAEATSSARSFADAQDSASLRLTPPEILLATSSTTLTASSSATLADLKITDTLSSDKLNVQDIRISGNLDIFGKTTMANTTIAGDLTVDGTLAIENGNEINVIGSSDCCNGTLYLQKSPLAQGLDILNGQVTIDKSGHLKAQIVTVAEFRVVANKISGSGKILSGTSLIDVENALVAPTSRILITPTSDTNLVLAVTDKLEGKKFTVSSPGLATKDIIFDWFIVNESAN